MWKCWHTHRWDSSRRRKSSRSSTTWGRDSKQAVCRKRYTIMPAVSKVSKVSKVSNVSNVLRCVYSNTFFSFLFF
jgi:hypothetical protein